MTPPGNSFLTAFLQLLGRNGPMSAHLVARHHFPDAGPALLASLTEDITEILWEAFGQGLVAVYQAEQGSSDWFILTVAGSAAALEAATEEDEGRQEERAEAACVTSTG